MRKFKLNSKTLLSLALVGVLSSGIVAGAASSKGQKYINSTCGYLVGKVTGTKGNNEKIYYSTANTDGKVDKMRSKLSVHYQKSGRQIGSGENTGWINSVKYVGTYDYEMHHFKNAETGKYDGFVNTKCKAYGTADAIKTNAYVIYTSVTY